jgi:hypothetical protein
LDKDRRYAIDAAIVRTMKSRKVRSWVLLMQVVNSNAPAKPDLKSAEAVEPV